MCRWQKSWKEKEKRSLCRTWAPEQDYEFKISAHPHPKASTCALPVTLEHIPLITSLTSLQHLFAFTKPSLVLFWSKNNTTSQTKQKSFMFSDHLSIYEFRHPLDVSSRFNTILNELLNSYSVLFRKSCKSLSSLCGASQGKHDIPVRKGSEVAPSDMTHREQALCFNILLWHNNMFQWPHKAFRHRGGRSVNHWWLHNKAAQVSRAWQVTGDLFRAPFRIILLQLHFLLAETWQIWQRDEKWIILDWLEGCHGFADCL